LNKQIIEERSQRPREKIAFWLENGLERIYGHGHEDAVVMERIKRSYHEESVIKPEDVPESFFETQRRLAKERGEGDVEITPDMRDSLIDIIIRDQESTLNTWIEYLSSRDANYPMWAKYWVFTGMLKLSQYNKETRTFGKRNKSTVSPFPDLNREALSYVMEIIEKKVNKEDIEGTEELEKLLKGSNFGKYYSYAIEKVTPASTNELLNTKGEWIKYEKGGDHKVLSRSLEGHGTGWCTAAESTAKIQLEGGDFYVYYSQDGKGKNRVPRIAIRMEGDKITEVRGVAYKQNMDPYIGDVLESKLQEFGKEGELYRKKESDMRRVTEISEKEELTQEDLRFIYEIDERIVGFGYGDDPRIAEIIGSREIRKDLSSIFDCREDQISTTLEEALSGDIKFHYGDLDLNSLKSVEGLVLPETVGGDLDLGWLQSAEGLVFPKTVGGDLYLNRFQSAEGLELPETVGGSLFLTRLQSVEGLVFRKQLVVILILIYSNQQKG
jgi:hypothetical protein